MDAHGKMRPLNDVMLEIAAKFSKMPDGAEKATLAMKLFGRSGTDMIPFLNQGAAGLTGLMQAAQQYGAVVGEEDVQATRALHMEFAQFKLRLDGVLITLARGLMPVLDTFFAVVNGQGMPTLLRFSQWFATEGAPRLQDFAIKVASAGEKELPKLFNGAKGVLTQLQPMVKPLEQIGSQLLGLLPSVAKASGLFNAWSSASGAMPSILNLVVVGLQIAAPLIKIVADNVGALVPATYAMATAFGAWKAIGIAQIVLGVAGAFTTMAAQEGILAAVTTLLGISFGPVTVALLAVAAVAGLVALAWKNNWFDIQGKTQVAIRLISGVVGDLVGFFRVAIPAIVTTVGNLWTGITTTLGNIVAWIRTWGPLIFVLLTGPIGLAVLWIIQNFGTIRDTAANILGAAVNVVRTVWGAVTSVLSAPVQAVAGILSGLWNGISNTAKGAWNGLLGAARTIFGSIADAISGIMSNIHIPMPHFNFTASKKNVMGVDMTVPSIDVKWYGMGGNFIANRPTLIGVGDGGPEAVSIQPLGRAGSAAGGVLVQFLGPVTIDSQDRIRQLGLEFDRQRRLSGGSLKLA